MGIGGRLVCRLDGGDLGLQRLELGFERGTAVFADAAREFGLFALLDRLLEAPADLLQLRERLRRHLRQSRQRFDTEGGVGRRLRAARIGAREPVGDMEEFAQAGGRLSGRDRFAMRCGVAGVLDEARLGGERLSDQGPEGRLGKVCRQRRLERVFQGAVVAKKPVDRGFQREPSIERRGTRIGMGETLRPRRMRKDVGEFVFQEGELRHRRSLRPPSP